MAICSNCGSPVLEGARFCTVCGAPVSASPEAEPAQAENPVPQAAYQQQVPPYSPPYVYAKPGIGSVFSFYRKAFAALGRKPIRLWGLSLLFLVIASLVSSLGSLVPLLSLPIVLILSLGFTGVLQDGYHGKDVRSEQLFQGFRKEEVVRNGAGMCWMMLWQLIWAFVPVMNIIKFYSYSFVPYILLTDKEITATEALRKSMRMTSGYKGKMFLADFLIGAGLFLTYLLLAILGRIPFVGILFSLLLVVFNLAVCLFLPIFSGLVRTAFFNEINAVHKD